MGDLKGKNMKYWKIFFTFILIIAGCTQQPAEVVHRKGGVYSPTYTENYIESPDGKMVRSLRGNTNTEKAQQISIINESAIEQNKVESRENGIYVVETGDNLSTIAERYDMTTKELAEINNIKSPYNIRVGQKLKLSGSTTNNNRIIEVEKPKEPQTIEYTVKSGDNLSSIARTYDIPTKELAAMNNIAAPYNIRIGQKLKVPNNKPIVQESKIITKTYVVQKGDSLLSIAKKNNMTLSNLAAINDIKSPYNIRIGQKITLVDKKTTKANEVKVAKNAPKTATTAKTTKPVVKTQPKTTTVVKTKKTSAGNSFIWPVKGEIVSNFGNKANGLYNDGMNIAAPKGTNFKATEKGVVAYVGNELRGYGTIILIKHDNNWISAYAHCASVKVARGDKVEKGQTIGTVGQTGNVSSPQLYFSLRNGREAVDPLKHLN